MSNKTARLIQRWVHIVLGVLLAVAIYSPLGAWPVVALLLKAVVIPGLVLSGVMLWQWPRLRSRFVLRRSPRPEAINDV